MIQANGCFKSNVNTEDKNSKESHHSYVNTVIDESDCTGLSASKLDYVYDPVNVYEKPDFIPQSRPIYEQLHV